MRDDQIEPHPIPVIPRPEPVDHEPDYIVGQIGSEYVVQFPGGFTITDPEQVLRFVLNQQPAERFHNMDSNAFNAHNREDYDPRRVISGDYDAADALLARFDPARSPVRLMIGSKAAGLKHAREIGKTWAALARANGLGVVSLDTDPERPGRPQNYRPGCPMVQLIARPEWEKGYTPGDCLVVYYQPVTTWVAKRNEIDRHGQPVEVCTELASASDPSGFVAVIDVVNLTPEGVDEWLKGVADAVRCVAEINAPAPEDGADAEWLSAERRAEMMRDLLNS
jgi:hypothetical protein